eukprot:SAG22_NODE_4119_length_1379_cov_1.209375_2_plen_232_part_01
MCAGINGQVFYALARKLTNWENHRTQSEVENALVMKNFVFQFINNYFVLFYLAYIRPFRETNTREPYISTSNVLQFQLMVVFTGKTLIKQAMGILKPWLKQKLALNKILSQMASDGHETTGFVGGITEKVGDSVGGLVEKSINVAESVKDKVTDIVPDTLVKTQTIKETNQLGTGSGADSPAGGGGAQPRLPDSPAGLHMGQVEQRKKADTTEHKLVTTATGELALTAGGSD